MASIDRDLEKLNPEQRDAAKTVNGPLLVLAGAGTGKTKVITTRIAYMLSQGIDPQSIVAVSFTNKAAKEMRERVASLVGDKLARNLELSTFHSFALRLLREYHAEAGLKKYFTVADERESFALLKEAIKQENFQDVFSPPAAVQMIAQFKDKLYTSKNFETSDLVYNRIMLGKLFEAYNRLLRLYNFVDFDDIIYLLALTLKNNPVVLKTIHEKFRYFMIDEYQDTSQSQFELVRMLGEYSQNVCVVGDDDQSIYSWRGANPDSIQNFLRAFPSAKRVTLEQNYRCSPNILNAANAVIEGNINRLGKTLWSQQPNLHLIQLHTAENERDEALFVCEKIKELRGSHADFNFGMATILVRANQQALAFEQVFEEQKIPYIVHGGTKFFDRKEIRDLASYMRLANNPRDLNSLFRIINLPSRGIGITTMEHIKHQFEQSQTDVIAILENMAPKHKGIQDFLKHWHVAKQSFDSSKHTLNGVATALHQCFETVGLREEILKTSASMQMANRRLEMCERFFDVIRNLDLKRPNLADIVDALHLDEPKFERAQDTSNSIQIMTIHASKGLEFPVVFIVGAEENIIPHERSIESPVGVEEERRLFYVALTRAKSRLFISHCGFRKKAMGSGGVEPQISRFLTNIPSDFMVASQTDPNAEEARRMDAAKKLFELFR